MSSALVKFRIHNYVFALFFFRWTKLVRNYAAIPRDEIVNNPFDDKKEPHALRYKRPKVKFLAQGVDLDKYTHKPIPYPKTGGRDWWGMLCLIHF